MTSVDGTLLAGSTRVHGPASGDFFRFLCLVLQID